MKKFASLFLIAALLLTLAATAAAADRMVYGTATLTYTEFYAGDVSSTDGLDAVTSATHGKAHTFQQAATDFVDEETNKDGYHITGVQNVNVAVPAADVEAYRAINPTFAESERVPAQYKPVTVTGDKAEYGTMVRNVADTVSDAELEVVTDSHWGDYQLNVKEISTRYIRNTREDGDFAIGSGIQGIIVETASGLKIGMQHLQSIWVQPWEISWNVTVDNSHNEEMIYANLSELDKLMGETVTKIVFLNANDAYVYDFEGAYLPVKFPSSMTVENAAAAGGETAMAVTGLPEDYAQAYSAEGLDAVVEAGKLVWKSGLPGAYTLVLNDANGKYAKLSADIVLLGGGSDKEQMLVAADGADEAMLEAFISNLETVTVNGTEYKASGRGAAVIINNIGELDTEAAVTSGKGAQAIVTPIFAESGAYTLVAKATGFENTLTFTVNIVK